MAYTFEGAVNELMLALGNPQTSPHIHDRCVQWMNTAQGLLARTNYDFPQFEATASLALVPGQAEYDLSVEPFIDNNIIGIRFVKNLTTGLGMFRWDWADYRRLVNQATGDPVRWARKGKTISFDPVPIRENLILSDYRRRPLEGILELDREMHDYCVAVATWLGATRLGMTDVAAASATLVPEAILQQVRNPINQDTLEALWNNPTLSPSYGPYLVTGGRYGF
jgi:hypothetical protein